MEPKYAFFKGRVVPYSEAKVGVLTHALNYGTAVFGGLRGYWNDDEKQPIFVNTFDQSQAMYAEINPPNDEPSAPVLSASVSVR